MVFVADDLTSWLIGLLAERGRRRLATVLLGSEQERALRSAATAAVRLAAEELHPDDDEQAEHLALVISQVFSEPVLDAVRGNQVTLLEALQVGIARQLTVLDDASLTHTGWSSADLLGVPCAVLVRKLTNHLLQEIVVRGVQGGPLTPLADQLNHDMTHLQGLRIENVVERLDSEVRNALARLESSEATSVPSALSAVGQFRQAAGPSTNERDGLTGAPVPQTPRPAQLPRTIRDFTGRADNLFQLQSMLEGHAQGAPGAIVISALAGQGGVGKTTLAVYLAHRYRPEFPDGQLYVNLRGMGPPGEVLSPGDVLADFLRSLGVDSPNIPDSLEARAAMFRSRTDDKRFLILLDNAADEQQVEPLLPASNLCAVLITSRSPLTALAGAGHLQMGVMSKRDALELFARLVPGELIEAAPAEAEAIVERCGYLPLAIRIAGAQVTERMDLAGYRRDLDRESSRLSALKHGNLDVRASLGLSYSYGLSTGAQRAFRMLGIIGAPAFPSWVVAALLDEDPERANNIVRELKRAQLLLDTGQDAAGHPRLAFHDLVRDMAREYLSTAERADGAERLATAYTALANQAHSLLEPPGPRDSDVDNDGLPGYLEEVGEAINIDWLAWFRDNRQNLLDVIRTASQQELWAVTSRLSELFTTLVEVPSYWDDWSQVSDIALEANRRGGLRAAEAGTLRHLGDLRVYQGRRSDAKVHLEESVGIFRELGDETGEAASLIRLGEVQRLTGDSANALKSMEHAKAIYQRLGDQLGAAYALTSIGGVLRVRARWDESIEAFLECIPVLMAAGRRRQAAIALVSLGDVYYLRSMWDEAYQRFDECLALFTSLGDQMWMQNTRRHIGLVHLSLGRTDDAMRCFSEALVAFEQIGDRRKEALTRWAIGDVCTYEGRYLESVANYQAALTVFEDINDRFCQAHVLRAKAASSIRLRDARAQQWVDASITAAQELQDDLMLARARVGLAELLHYQNRPDEAIAAAQGSLKILRQRGDRLWQAKALTCLASLYIDCNERTRSQETFAEALTIHQEIHVPVPAELQAMRSAIGV